MEFIYKSKVYTNNGDTTNPYGKNVTLEAFLGGPVEKESVEATAKVTQLTKEALQHHDRSFESTRGPSTDSSSAGTVFYNASEASVRAEDSQSNATDFQHIYAQAAGREDALKPSEPEVRNVTNLIEYYNGLDAYFASTRGGINK